MCSILDSEEADPEPLPEPEAEMDGIESDVEVCQSLAVFYFFLVAGALS